MKKSKDIVTAIHSKTAYSKREIEAIMKSVFDEIVFSLSNGESVQIHGFGTFEPKELKQRVGQDMNNGNSVVIPSRVYPKFRPGATLKNAVIKERKGD